MKPAMIVLLTVLALIGASHIEATSVANATIRMATVLVATVWFLRTVFKVAKQELEIE